MHVEKIPLKIILLVMPDNMRRTTESDQKVHVPRSLHEMRKGGKDRQRGGKAAAAAGKESERDGRSKGHRT